MNTLCNISGECEAMMKIVSDKSTAFRFADQSNLPSEY